MIFGERLSTIRKKQKISQEKLAKAIGVHAPVIGRYERNEVKPSIEVATQLSMALGVSLDYLVGNTDQEVDKNLLGKVVEIQQLEPSVKDHILYTLEAMLRDAKTRHAYAS